MSSNQFRPTVEKWTRTLRSTERCNFFWAPNKDWIACSHKNHPCYLQWKLFMHIYVTSQTRLDWTHSFWNSDENLMHRRLCLICAFFYFIFMFPKQSCKCIDFWIWNFHHWEFSHFFLEEYMNYELIFFLSFFLKQPTNPASNSLCFPLLLQKCFFKCSLTRPDFVQFQKIVFK